ncbi:MAG: class I SAM-dependent methyltransferase [Pseudomonadota bacterium]
MPLDDGTDLYDDPELYDMEHAGYAGDVPWYLALCRRPGVQRVLELGCGTGRLLLPLRHAGVQVLGVDASPAMIAHCQYRLGALLPMLPGHALCQVGDMRTLRGAADSMDLVIAAFNTLQHVDERDIDAVLETVRHHLSPAGLFAFDVYAPARELEHARMHEDAQVARDALGQPWQVTRQRQLEVRTSWLESRFRCEPVPADAPGSETTQRRLRQYQWTRDALASALRRHGLQLCVEAGDLDGRPLTLHSPRWLAVARPGQDDSC